MAKNEKNVEKKSGFFSKVGNFFAKLGERIKGLKSEWKKVSWASPKSTFKNFALVLVVVICFAVALGVIDVVSGMGVTGLNTLFNNWFPNLFTL
ncbi:MAG: preprotein translocase subunit SecE [Ruminococcaceae bacterium]|nr:preprotein translocase subunit SecE [Oscillospiraceae bacterium]